jgi:8-amino-3,8-dideoxy-alpha-D-manno-octulosonate transaminase
MPGFELFGDEERKEVNEVLETGVLMRYGFDAQRKGRWKAKEFEAAISEKLAVPYTQLASSGTAALSTAMAALGIGAGDEIIMPVFTFVASFESVFSVGAIPVLVDIDETLTMNPAAVRAAITPKTKAVMPVHMCGAMADLDTLKAICQEHNLILLEDACQSFGGSYKGQALGTIGDAGTFSFDFVKTITCGEGGAVVTHRKDVYTHADAYTDHGHDHLGTDRGADEHPFIGYNYRISELHAAVGLAQIKKLDQFLSIQRSTKKTFKDALSSIEGLTFRLIPDPEGDTATFLCFFLPDEQQARQAAANMKAAGLVAFYYFDNNWHYLRNWNHFKESKSLSPFHKELATAMERYKTKQFPVSDEIMKRCVCTPINLAWSEDEIQQRAGLLRKAVATACGQ